MKYEEQMTEYEDITPQNGQAVAAQEVFPPARPAPSGTKAGSTEDLKALHAALTTAYREYLEMAKIKPQMLNPAMLGLIQQFLRHNDIAAEAAQQTEVDALQKRLEQKRKARENALKGQNVVTLNKSKEA